MPGAVDTRLKDLGIELPNPAPAAANYVPFVVSRGHVYVAGQVPFGPDGNLHYQGKVGAEFTVDEGQEAAQLCALNILAQVKAACDGDLDRVIRCVKLGGFVNCPPDFDQHPAVINGASDLMVAVLAGKGRHARFAVGAANLPFNVAVEIDAVFEIA
jgi:enamine deaminase RidA (YjgF/YER057c/UK114 family)